MLNIFPKAIRMMALKPGILIPGILSIIATILIYGIIYIFVGDIEELLLYGTSIFPPASISEFGSFFLSTGVLIILSSMIIFGLIEVIFTIATADYVRQLKQRGTANIIPSIRYGIEKTGDAFIVILLLVLIGLGALIAFSFLNELINSLGIISIILQGIFAVVGVYLAIRLMFTIIILSMDGVPVKQALQKSWAFTGQHFWSALFLAVILIFISGIIDGIMVSIFPEIASEFELAISSIVDLISGVFTVVALAIFYSENKQ